MSIQTPNESENGLRISREFISILLLFIGSILIIIGAFMTWGLSIGLFVIGLLIFVVSIAIGWQR